MSTLLHPARPDTARNAPTLVAALASLANALDGVFEQARRSGLSTGALAHIDRARNEIRHAIALPFAHRTEG